MHQPLRHVICADCIRSRGGGTAVLRAKDFAMHPNMSLFMRISSVMSDNTDEHLTEQLAILSHTLAMLQFD